MRRPSTVLLSVLVAAILAAGCSDAATVEEPGSATASHPTGAAGDFTPGSASLVLLSFGETGLEAGDLRVPAGSEVVLVVASKDGRPHGLTVEGLPGPPRAVVTPGATRELPLGVVKAGRYRLAPDGAAEPLILVVE